MLEHTLGISQQKPVTGTMIEEDQRGMQKLHGYPGCGMKVIAPHHVRGPGDVAAETLE